jgi:methylmalonyl-CoA/ethylmalonyl-CoA epimerase
VSSTEVVEAVGVRLTFLDAGGGVSLQLVEPVRDDSPLAADLAERGEGLHHVAFAVDDVAASAAGLADAGAPPVRVEVPQVDAAQS